MPVLAARRAHGPCARAGSAAPSLPAAPLRNGDILADPRLVAVRSAPGLHRLCTRMGCPGELVGILGSRTFCCQTGSSAWRLGPPSGEGKPRGVALSRRHTGEQCQRPEALFLCVGDIGTRSERGSCEPSAVPGAPDASPPGKPVRRTAVQSARLILRLPPDGVALCLVSGPPLRWASNPVGGSVLSLVATATICSVPAAVP